MAIRTLHKTVRVRKMKPSKADKTDCFENEVESLLDEVPSSTTNWDDYPELAPPKPTTPVPHVDANARSTSARIADQPDANVCSINARIADSYDANVRSSSAHIVDQYDANVCTANAHIAARTDASVCSEDARTAAQYAEERTSHAKWQQNGAAMQVESTDFPIQNVELMPSNSIQTAHTPILMPAQHSEDISL